MNLNDVHRGIQQAQEAASASAAAPGRGHGKTSGRGHKGQGPGPAGPRLPIFEGGPDAAGPPRPQARLPQPLRRRSRRRQRRATWRSASRPATRSTSETLRAKSLVRGQFDVLKVLGDGELTKSLKVSAHRFSRSALEKIQQAGGEAVVLPGKKPVVKNKTRG